MNGTVELKTGNWLTSARRFDNQAAPVQFDAAARSDLWERFIQESTAGAGRKRISPAGSGL